MQPWTKVTGVIAPLLRDDVDTDAIIPAAYMRSLSTDPGEGLFARWRYRPDGTNDPSFVLNDPRFRRATFLLAGRNFGCGSSRENAVWALQRFGIRAVVALSFSDIFHQNALKSGLLPVTLPASEHAIVAHQAATLAALTLRIDVATRTITPPGAPPMRFALDPRHRNQLLHGLDEITETLSHREQIGRFRDAQRARFPWLDLVDTAAKRP
jgi:3-isopropylmalate/(R)-2-methylmalate dehydratase small subunit